MTGVEFLADVEALLEQYERAAEEHAQAVVREMELEDQKPIAKAEAIARVMQTENTETKRQHSASSAEKICEADPEYAAFLSAKRAATLRKMNLYTRVVSAKLRAQSAIAARGDL